MTNRPISPDPASHDALIRTAFNDFRYVDKTIHVIVANTAYQISQSRLWLRFPHFPHLRGSFRVPQTDLGGSGTPIELDVQEPEWKALLWYIHADPGAGDAFADSPASTAKCARYLGVAIMSHLLFAADIAQWAVGKALEMLTQPARTFHVNAELARLLISVAAYWDEGSTTTTQCRDIVCDAFYPTMSGDLADDPILALEVSRGDKFILSHIYFYILRKGPSYDWIKDARVHPIDRIRLLCGSYSLFPLFPPPQSAFSSYPPSSSDLVPVSPPPEPQNMWTLSTLLTSLSWSHTAAPQEEQTRSSWHPKIDPQIICARDRLWDHFDETQWGLAM